MTDSRNNHSSSLDHSSLLDLDDSLKEGSMDTSRVPPGKRESTPVPMGGLPITHNKVNISDKLSRKQMTGLEYQMDLRSKNNTRVLNSFPAQGSELNRQGLSQTGMRVNSLRYECMSKAKAGMVNKNSSSPQGKVELNPRAFAGDDTEEKPNQLYRRLKEKNYQSPPRTITLETINPPVKRKRKAIRLERTPSPAREVDTYSLTETESTADSGVVTSNKHRYPVCYQGRSSNHHKKSRIANSKLAEMEERLHTLTMFYNQLQHQEVIVEAEINAIRAQMVKLESPTRSEERRGGKEGRSRWWPYH